MISLFQSLLAPGKCVGNTQVWVCHRPQKHYYKQRSALLTWFMGRGFACRRVECWDVRRDKWPCFEQVQKNWVKYRVLSKLSRSDSSFIIFITIDVIRLRLPNVQQIPLKNPSASPSAKACKFGSTYKRHTFCGSHGFLGGTKHTNKEWLWGV